MAQQKYICASYFSGEEYDIIRRGFYLFVSRKCDANSRREQITSLDQRE